MVDERAIRREVEDRQDTIHLRAEWMTPSGRQRSVPMFMAEISNQYLGLQRLLKGQDRDALVARANEQLARWREQEIRGRTKGAHQDAKESALSDCEARGEAARTLIQELQVVLAATLTVDDRIDWDSLLDDTPFRAFAFRSPPAPPPAPLDPGERVKSFWEFFFPWIRKRRLEADQADREAYEAECRRVDETRQSQRSAWEAERKAAQRGHEAEAARYIEQQRARNDQVRQFRKRFEAGEPAAVVEYLVQVFERSMYPEGFFVEHEVDYEPSSRTAVVNLTLPTLDDFPTEADFKFAARGLECRPVLLKTKERNELYDGALKQTVLRTLHEVFEAVYTNAVDICVVNGWVLTTDKKSGQDVRPCILSVSATRTVFEAFNLARVDPTECIRGLKGLIAGSLAELAPVRPILVLSKEDKRFVEGREILGHMDEFTNLAKMSWQDFEHLIRELFERMFRASGADVKVTRSSKDGGVDAVVFDPDPIRGGKIIIQAKRYSKTVPVAAVRELQGTVMNEGASKGILVTTAHFGRDAREFALKWPLSLIDGANLVHLLGQHGHQVRIDFGAEGPRQPAMD